LGLMLKLFTLRSELRSQGCRSKMKTMADDLKDPKPLSAKQVDFLRTECPSNRWQFYGGKERYKFADKLPTTPKRAVEKWDYILVVTSAGVSGLRTYIEGHRPDRAKGEQDADLYLYEYGKNQGEGGVAYHLAHPTYTGRSIPLRVAPTSAVSASALARTMGLTAESGPTGALSEEHRKGLTHFEAIVVGVANKDTD